MGTKPLNVTLWSMMRISNQHKAVVLTFLSIMTMVVGMLNFGLNHIPPPRVIHFELEPYLDQKSNELVEKSLTDSQNKLKTNEAFDQNAMNKRLAHAYSFIEPPKDYEPPELGSRKDNSLKENITKHSHKESTAIQSLAYDQVNDILRKRQIDKSNVKESSVRYSLIAREHVQLPTPTYLCQVNGKIIINITVDRNGNVMSAHYNQSSSSTNQCLIDHAIAYAKKAQFNADDTKRSQIGTITYYFQGKY